MKLNYCYYKYIDILNSSITEEDNAISDETVIHMSGTRTKYFRTPNFNQRKIN